MIMCKMITVAMMYLAVSSCLAAATAEMEHYENPNDAPQQPADEAETDLQQQTVDLDNSGINVKLTDMAARFIQDYITPAVCSYLPGFCSRNQIRESDNFLEYPFHSHNPIM